MTWQNQPAHEAHAAPNPLPLHFLIIAVGLDAIGEREWPAETDSQETLHEAYECLRLLPFLSFGPKVRSYRPPANQPIKHSLWLYPSGFFPRQFGLFPSVHRGLPTLEAERLHRGHKD